jgi:hypothetical protein
MKRNLFEADKCEGFLCATCPAPVITDYKGIGVGVDASGILLESLGQ